MADARDDLDDPYVRERFRSALAELDRNRLQERFAGLALVRIAEAPERTPVRISGEVRSHHRSSHVDAPWCRVEITDGSANAVAHFTGRRRLEGLDAGRGVLLEGVGRKEKGKLVLVNPAYTLLP